MSNCDFVAGRSLIALAASRLALRTPALRAATALTRPKRSAQRPPCAAVTRASPTGAEPSAERSAVDRPVRHARVHELKRVGKHCSGGVEYKGLPPH
jgi:hypothetical protein